MSPLVQSLPRFLFLLLNIQLNRFKQEHQKEPFLSLYTILLLSSKLYRLFFVGRRVLSKFHAGNRLYHNFEGKPILS